MPTHVHVIIQFADSTAAIPEIWRVFKSKTSVMARKSGFAGVHLWQKNYFEHVIRNEDALKRITLYIRDNPFKAEISFDQIYGDRIPKLDV